jgi:hypothetical protein
MDIGFCILYFSVCNDLFFLYLPNGLANIEIDRAIEDASSAADAGDPAKILRKIVELVHDPLPGPLPAGRPRIMARGFLGIKGKKAGIPVSHPPPLVPAGLIDHIKTVTRGAEKGAGPAADTLLMEPVPERTFDDFVQLLLYFFNRKRSTGRRLHLFQSFFFNLPGKGKIFGPGLF